MSGTAFYKSKRRIETFFSKRGLVDLMVYTLGSSKEDLKDELLAGNGDCAGQQ